MSSGWRGARPSARQVVWAAAVFSVVWRFPSLMWPLRPDEAGFLMVARAWDPQPDSVFGPYFVDRTPMMIALVKAADWVAGPYGLRFLAAAACLWLVLLVAAVGRRMGGERGGAWAAVITAALVTTTAIDPIAAKGEILGIPLVVASFWCALTALERDGRAAVLRAWAAGTLAVSAIGLKQSLAAGLLFGGVVVLGSWLAGRIDRRTFVRLSAAAAVGAATPLMVFGAWALASGVSLDTMWHVSFGFRGLANEVLTEQSQAAPDRRAGELRWLALVSGITLALVWFVLNLKSAWRRDPVLAVAVLAVIVLDFVGVYAGGSYWRPYLLQLVPGTALAVAFVTGLPSWRGTVMRMVAVAAVVSALWSNVIWTVWQVQGESFPSQTYAGEAIGAVSEAGDSMVVFGGRADLQFASGLPSPYPYLWSLPMRTEDPELVRLRALLAGPDAPTWFVEGVSMESWDLPNNEALQDLVIQRYDYVETVCGSQVWLRTDASRAAPVGDCETPWFRHTGVGFLLDRHPIPSP